MNIKKVLPIVDWLPNYKKENLIGDLSAGLTVGVMLIPQGMAYAMIAGLPPVYGLYASIVPQVIYTLFGTSRQLGVGPVAMDSLLVAAGVSAIAVAGTDEYISLAILLAFMMGVIQLLFGVFKLGFVVNFLSKPVISGFTSAAALIIGINQIKHILGVEIARNNNVFILLYDAILQINHYNWIAIGIGGVSIIILKVVKKIHKMIPGALIVVILSIVTVYLGDLHLHGVQIVGDIPEGLPSFVIPTLTTSHFQELIPIAITLSIIAFMESISVAKALHVNHKKEYKIDNNQEFIGIGMGNIIGSFFLSYPTTGGFSRSAVNDQAGAKTNLANIISALLIVFTLLFLTPLFYYLPKTILGAIILVAVFGLLDTKLPSILWKNNKQDFFLLITAFVVTLAIGIKEGIAAGVVLSIIILIYRTATPHIAILGRLPNTKDYRNINRFDDIETRDNILVIRHDAQLYFANITHFIDKINEEIDQKSKTKLLILHCGSISHIDSTALQALKELIISLEEKNIDIAFSGIIGPVRDYLSRNNFTTELGKEKFFIDVQSAIDYFDNCSGSIQKAKFKYATQTNIFKEKEI